MENIWPAISQHLAKTIDPAQFKVWIAPLAGAFNGTELTLVARNDFVVKFIRSHFLEVIMQSASTILDESVKISIIPASESVELKGSKVITGCADAAKSETHTHTSYKPNSGAAVSSLAHSSMNDGVSVLSMPDKGILPQQSGRIFQPATQLAPRAGAVEQGHLPLGFADDSFTEAQAHRLIRSWRHSFDDFVVGPCNELAYAAARSVCERHSSFGAVLFLCSGAGLGKTHLLQSVGASLVKSSNFRYPRIEYITAEEFASHMRLALRSGEIDRFKARFRETDALLLEDVHFLQEKEKTQDEVLATITALLDRGSKVIFSSSFAPRDLRKMDGQLLSRLSSGMIANIDRPDRDTRRRIISNKASMHQMKLSDDIADYLADTMEVDVRQIESCIQNLALKARFFNRAITLDMARETVSNYMDSVAIVNLPEIIHMVCQGFGVSAEALNSKSRKQEFVQARNTAFYLARKHTSLSLQEIGRHFNRTHSTVIKGITSLEREVSRQSHSGRQLASTIALIEKNANLAQ